MTKSEFRKISAQLVSEYVKKDSVEVCPPAKYKNITFNRHKSSIFNRGRQRSAFKHALVLPEIR